jgi:hypothetical protein
VAERGTGELVADRLDLRGLRPRARFERKLSSYTLVSLPQHPQGDRRLDRLRGKTKCMIVISGASGLIASLKLTHLFHQNF